MALRFHAFVSCYPLFWASFLTLGHTIPHGLFMAVFAVCALHVGFIICALLAALWGIDAVLVEPLLLPIPMLQRHSRGCDLRFTEFKDLLIGASDP